MWRALLSAIGALASLPLAVGQYGDTSALPPAAKPQDRQDVKSVPPPQGALVLFAGRSLNQWVMVDGQAPNWTIRDGVLQVGEGDLRTREIFGGHFSLHLEFRVPYLPDAKPLRRGNSGVFLQGRYQVQILDSYGVNSTYRDCGALYDLVPPRLNACKLPTVWQSYDIEFWSARCGRTRIDLPPRLGIGHDIHVWSSDRQKLSPAYITVMQNGVTIHDQFAIPVDNTPFGLGGDACDPGPIMLQDQGSAVQFRNIWLVEGGAVVRRETGDARAAVELTVHVPAAAELWINGTRTSHEGAVRHFLSPAIEPGYTYTYELKASWREGEKTVTRTREVKVQPGDRLEVDMQSSK